MITLPSQTGPVDITDDIIRALQLRYPGVDIEDNLILMKWYMVKTPSRIPKKLFRFMETWLKKQKPRPATKLRSMMTEKQLLAEGQKNGIVPRPGEDWVSFDQRLRGMK